MWPAKAQFVAISGLVAFRVFFGHICHISFYHPHKVWFLLAALSIRNLDLDSGSKMMSYSFQDDLSVLQTLPDSLH